MSRDQRKLVAILATDVVGYSRLMGRDEGGTEVRVCKHRRQRRADPNAPRRPAQRTLQAGLV